MKLALRAIVAAAEDAGIDPRDIDGFVSYGSEKNPPWKLLPALGTKELRFGALMWTHGGGIPGALGLAADAIISGRANIVAVFRSLAESSGERLRVAVAQADTSAQYLVNGLDAPVQICAIRTQRLVELGLPKSALRAMAMASYYHARRNEAANGRNIDLDEETYEASRLISEPLHLFDCSRENDGAAAVILVAAERAKDYRQKPAYLLSAPSGVDAGWAGSPEEAHSDYLSAGFKSVARRLWEESGYGPSDVDVAQVYENATGPAAAALLDHGFCTLENAEEFFRFENLIAPNGGLPINTSGGNLAEGFIHGMSLVPEAVRQIRGTSVNQVPGAKLSLMTGGPSDAMVSSALFGSEDAL